MWARIVIALGADKTPSMHAPGRSPCPEQVRSVSLDPPLEVANLNSTPAGCGLRRSLRDSTASRRRWIDLCRLGCAWLPGPYGWPDRRSASAGPSERQAQASVIPKTTWTSAVAQPRETENQGKIAVNPCRLTP